MLMVDRLQRFVAVEAVEELWLEARHGQEVRSNQRRSRHVEIGLEGVGVQLAQRNQQVHRLIPVDPVKRSTSSAR